MGSGNSKKADRTGVWNEMALLSYVLPLRLDGNFLRDRSVGTLDMGDAFLCDRCNEFSVGNSPYVLTVEKRKTVMSDEKLFTSRKADLCSECTDEFAAFMGD